jgi:PAS domain S-box-containing protein
MGADRSKEERLRFYELPADLLGVAGFDGYFKELGRAWERTLAYTCEELLATPYIEFVHEDDRAATLARVEGLSRGADIATFQNRYRCKDGSYRWIEWNATPYREDGLIYFVGRDITERRRVEEQRQESEENLQALVDALPNFVMNLDLEGRIVFINRVVEGLAIGQVLGTSMFLFIPPEFHDTVRQAFESVVQTGKPVRYFTQGPGIHGASSWYASYLGPIWRDGKLVAVTLTTEDITERRLAEEAVKASEARLKAYAEELEEKNRLLAEENAERERIGQMMARQQETLRALSTPIIQAWEGVLVLPIIGTLDSTRAGQMMEKLLAEIARIGARFAILDLTGVEAVDTSTLDHLLRVVRATSLLGSRCLVSGVSPSIARAMVEIGASAESFLTFGLLQDALRHALLSSGAGAAGW